MFHHLSLKVTCIILLVIGMLAGCARPGDPPLIVRLMPLLKVAATLGTHRALAENPSAVVPVIQVSDALLTLFNTDETVTMAQFHASIRARLATLNLSLEMKAIIEGVFGTVIEELRAVILYHGVSDDQVTLLLHEVVSWIRDAAMLHLPPGIVVKPLQRK